MCIFYADPLFFWPLNDFLVLIGYGRLLVVDRVADVGLIFQDVSDDCQRPGVRFVWWRIREDITEFSVAHVFPIGRSRNLFVIQYPGDLGRAAAMGSKIKDLFDDPSGFLVDHDLVFRVWILHVSKRSIGRCYFPRRMFCSQCGLYLSAGILGKPLIEQILEGDEIAQTLFGVLVLCDGDVADVLFREHELQIIIHHHMHGQNGKGLL